MRIGSSTLGQNYFAGVAGSKPVSGSDAYSKNMEEQIRNAEKKLQYLSKDDRIPPDERMKKQQEIRKEITELQAQLRQHEMEICQGDRQQKASGTSMEDMLGGETHLRGKGGKKGTGFSDAGMKAMISADASIKQADVQGAVKTTMEGKAGVLESEIKLDKDRGEDTARKEAELADLQAGVSDLTSGQLKTLSAANKEMEEAGKEETSAEGSATKVKEQESGVKESTESGMVNSDDEEKNVLRSAAWMTKTTSLTENMLSKAGISITAGNKLELDEDELKNANISDLKSLFTGSNSYASKMLSKGKSISLAAAGAGGTYTSSGHYSNALPPLVSGKIDTKK